MATRKAVAQKEPTLAPDRALKALRQQLEALQRLKNRSYQEAKAEETEWKHFTESIIEIAFGNPSTSLSKFYLARSAGVHYVGLRGISPQQRQLNFESRIRRSSRKLPSQTDSLQGDWPAVVAFRGNISGGGWRPVLARRTAGSETTSR